MTTTADSQVIQHLLDQHELIKSLMHDVRECEPSQRADRFAEFKHFLAVHEALEEEVVHPMARAAVADSQVVGHSIDEEHQAAGAVSKLEQLDAKSPDFERAFLELQQAVLHHAQHEETEEFPSLNDLDSATASRLEAGIGKALDYANTSIDHRGTFRETFTEAREIFRA